MTLARIGLVVLATLVAWGGTAGYAAPDRGEDREPPPAPAFHVEGPPPGHTGGFGEPSCLACHTEFDLNVGGSLTLEGLPSAYEPGAAYLVSVVLRSSEMARAGFQAAARFTGADEGARGRPAGSLEAVDHRTAVVSDSAGAMRYVQHVAASTDVGDPDLAIWTFQWTAPLDGGRVVFHAAANSADGDNSPLGDLVYTTELGVEPGAGAPPGPGGDATPE